MKFIETPLHGAYLLEEEPSRDERGHFARFFCAREFAERGLIATIAQGSVSFNPRQGTLRGLHYQAPPHSEAKTVRCLRGCIYDVIVDLRPGSQTRHRWYGVELGSRWGRALYVPPGFAHGFITLEEDSLVEYLISDFYVAEAARGIRYDDPTLAIRWPFPPKLLSARDRALPSLQEAGIA